MQHGLWVIAAALLVILWVVLRRRRPRAERPDAVDAADHLTPKPVEEQFAEDEWDGFTGMQDALAVELSDGTYFPLILAGTAPPAERTQTFTTGTPEETHLTIVLSLGQRGDRSSMRRMRELSVGPIPVTGDPVREVDVTFRVDDGGAVSVEAKRSSDGLLIRCEAVQDYVGAVAVGRR